MGARRSRVLGSGMRFLLMGMLIAAIAALGSVGIRAQDLRFVAGTGDVPLMAGLSPVPEESFAFDKPEGRIVEATVRGAVPAERVRIFYAAALPQLGWRADDGGFTRGGERLILEVVAEAAGVRVRFLIAPR